MAFNLNNHLLQSQAPAMPESSQGAGNGLALLPSAPCVREMEAHGFQVPSAPISREVVIARRRERRRHKRELRRLRKLPKLDNQGRTCYFTEEGARQARLPTRGGRGNESDRDMVNKMEVMEHSAIPGAGLPIRVLQNIIIRPAAAPSQPMLHAEQPALPSPHRHVPRRPRCAIRLPIRAVGCSRRTGR